VRLSRRAVAAHLRTLQKAWGGDAPVRMGSILPVHHADGMFQGALLPMLLDGFAWLSPAGGWDHLGPLGDAVHRHALTHVLVTPTHLAHFFSRTAGGSDEFRRPGFRFAISTAAPLADDVWEHFQRVFGVPLANVYGLTETVAGSCFAIPGTTSHRMGTVGAAVDCDVRVVGNDGAPMPTGMRGELQIRGPHVFSGYVGEDSSDRLDAGGWLRTGDEGSIDADGCVRIHGRLASSFKSGATLVNPEATTAALRRHAGVLDAASVGVPDPSMGTLLVSVVVPRAGSSIQPAQLIDALRARLPAHQLPRHLLFVDELPMGPSGKVQRERLMALVTSRLVQSTTPGESPWHIVQRLGAEAFGAAPEDLSAHDTPSTVAGWDSFGHLTFVSGLESALGRTLALEEIIGLRSLADAVFLLENVRL
jgi:acyl-CoA synthetase (AMP-forming)/AMP-acid ligase II/acyl carrier protein